MNYYRGSARKGGNESRRTNRTLIGLDSVLDKYQRENTLLTKQVTKLKQENQKLVTGSFSKGEDDERMYKKVLKPKWENIDLQLPSRSIETKQYGRKNNYTYYAEHSNEELESQKTKRKEAESRPYLSYK